MSLARALERAVATLDPIADACGQPEARRDAVSHWSVGQHIDHALKVDAHILGVLHRSPLKPEPVPPPSLIGRLILLTGRIPRGKGRAPDFTVPDIEDYVALRGRVAEAARGYAELEPHLALIATDRRRFAHPILGGFTRAQWLRFASIHHRHHAAIIADILR